ncbi:hypothetical protein Taro_031696 [Colocasia esculenta]|uniref:Uncharacterized protein n=1 Tax=Colocasia esculenta TaxID=4460 RepID=A0A843VPJ0_COLES|nr:hypothetical protein [Colocasia esculenta]
MEVPTHVESSEACAGPVSETTGSPGGVESLLSSLQSIDQDDALLPSVRETHEELPKDDDIDDWDYELAVTDIPILDPNWDPSMENPDDPCFSIPFDDLMEMMRDPLPAINEEVPQATTIVVESIAGDAAVSLPIEGKNELPTPFHLLLDSSVPHEETGIPDKPSSQPSEPGLDRSPQALEVLKAQLATLRSEAIGTTGKISMVRDQHTSLLSTQKKKSARATLLRMLASYLDRSVAEDMQDSIALAARLLSLEAKQSKIHATINALEAEVDLLRACATGVELKASLEAMRLKNFGFMYGRELEASLRAMVQLPGAYPEGARAHTTLTTTLLLVVRVC